MPNELVPTPPDGQILIYKDGGLNLQVRLDGQTVWLTQKLIAELFEVSIPTVNEHLANIYDEKELDPTPTIRKFRIVQSEGSRQVSRLVDHYNLDAIVAVGLRVRSARGTTFRQWAVARLTELLTKGFTLDDERIKAGRTLGDDYFEELLARIRDIRSSERLFYQKITDIVPKRYGDKGLFSHHIYRIQAKDTSYLPTWFIYLLLRTPVFHELVAGHSNGTTVNMLPLDGLQKPRFVLPPEQLVRHFGKIPARAGAGRRRCREVGRTRPADRRGVRPAGVRVAVRHHRALVGDAARVPPGDVRAAGEGAVRRDRRGGDFVRPTPTQRRPSAGARRRPTR